VSLKIKRDNATGLDLKHAGILFESHICMVYPKVSRDSPQSFYLNVGITRY
jgi:hypothetical protein